MTNTKCMRAIQQHYCLLLVNDDDTISDIDALDASFVGEKAFIGTRLSSQERRNRALDIAFSVRDHLLEERCSTTT